MPDNSWERQAKESPQAYEAFIVYRDLGVGRTYTAVAQKLRKSDSLIRRWKNTWDWASRADDWDNYIASKAADKAAEDYAKMLELQINIGKMMQAKGTRALQGMDFDNVPMKFLPSIVNLINSGGAMERSARELGKLKGKAAENNFLADALNKIWAERSNVK